LAIVTKRAVAIAALPRNFAVEDRDTLLGILSTKRLRRTALRRRISCYARPVNVERQLSARDLVVLARACREQR
jgi:hypothetical protein